MNAQNGNGVVLITTIVIAIVFIVVLVLAGKKSQTMKDNYARLKIGMSKSEVIAMFGQPTTVGKKADGSEILRWTLNEEMLHSVLDKDTTRGVVVNIKDGKVISFDGHNINKRIW